MIDLGHEYKEEKDNYCCLAGFLEDYGKEISRDINYTSRWSTFYTNVYKYNDRYFEFEEERGSTEYQDSPDEPHSDIIEVEPVEETITRVVYKPIKEKKNDM